MLNQCLLTGNLDADTRGEFLHILQDRFSVIKKGELLDKRGVLAEIGGSGVTISAQGCQDCHHWNIGPETDEGPHKSSFQLIANSS